MSDSRTLQETQTMGIHDVLKGLQSIIGRIQTQSAVCKFSDDRIFLYSKGKGWIDFFSQFECFRSKDLPI